MKFSTTASMPHRNGCGSPTSQVSTVAAIPETDVHDGQCAEINRRVDLNILEDVLCPLPRTVVAEHQQHPALNIAMVNQVEDQRDEKDQRFADQRRQHGEDDSYNIGRGQVDGARTLVSAPGHL